MGISKKILFIIFIIFFQSYSIFSAERPRVAVMPFTAGSGISKPEARYLTDSVRDELIKVGKYDVISNDQLKTMLKTKAMKQKLGKGSCSTEKCIIDLGNALECEKMIIGKAASAFGEYSISVKLLNVVKQKYEIAERIRIKNKSEFPNAAQKVVGLLIGKVTNDSDENQEYNSPFVAGISSLLPFWSGSWNVPEHRIKGSLLVIGKMAFPVFVFLATSGIYADPSDMMVFSLLVLSGFSLLTDPIYSYSVVSRYNRKHRITANNNSSGDIYFDINPRIGTYSSKGLNPTAIEGINLSVAYRF